MRLTLDVKPFSFDLNQPLRTSQGALKTKQGWLLRLATSSGHRGWGEVSPINSHELGLCASSLNKLTQTPSRQELEDGALAGPAALAFGIGAALAELDDVVASDGQKIWLEAPESAFLLPTNHSLLNIVNELVRSNQGEKHSLTLKLKVAIKPKKQEMSVVHKILDLLPSNARLRLDANAGWNPIEAHEWATEFFQDPRLEWLEQPLPANDIQGLSALSQQFPIALDESLSFNPSLRKSWQGWQIRRPLLDGDPRILLNELKNGIGYRVLSTAFETGIGRRWIHHLAALQQKGPTPTAPGLAPGWCPKGPLFSNDPEKVWESTCKN